MYFSMFGLVYFSKGIFVTLLIYSVKQMWRSNLKCVFKSFGVVFSIFFSWYERYYSSNYAVLGRGGN